MSLLNSVIILFKYTALFNLNIFFKFKNFKDMICLKQLQHESKMPLVYVCDNINLLIMSNFQ